MINMQSFILIIDTYLQCNYIILYMTCKKLVKTSAMFCRHIRHKFISISAQPSEMGGGGGQNYAIFDINICSARMRLEKFNICHKYASLPYLIHKFYLTPRKFLIKHQLKEETIYILLSISSFFSRQKARAYVWADLLFPFTELQVMTPYCTLNDLSHKFQL